MSTARRVLVQLNRCLSSLNLELRTLTASKQEMVRLQKAKARGAFSSAVYPVPKGYLQKLHVEILDALPQHKDRFATFQRTEDNDVGYKFDNGFFSSPDTDVLYTVVRMFRPKTILEIGCGNSTRVMRQAVIDGGFSTVITCVDPFPRCDISR